MDSAVCISLRVVCYRAVRSGASRRHDQPSLVERRVIAPPLPFVALGKQSGAGCGGVTAQGANREIGVPGKTKNEGLAARAFGPVPTLRASGQAKRGRLRRRHRAKRQSGDWRFRENQKRRLGGTCVWLRRYASCLGASEAGGLRRRHCAKRQSGDWRSRENQKRRPSGACVWPRAYPSCLWANEAGQGVKASPRKPPIRRLAFPGKPRTKAWRQVRLAPSLRFVAQGERGGAGYKGVTAQSANREIGVSGKTKNEAETKNEN
jgi:hypothetical protein